MALPRRREDARISCCLAGFQPPASPSLHRPGFLALPPRRYRRSAGHDMVTWSFQLRTLRSLDGFNGLELR
jgi:hypothetical protein